MTFSSFKLIFAHPITHHRLPFLATQTHQGKLLYTRSMRNCCCCTLGIPLDSLLFPGSFALCCFALTANEVLYAHSFCDGVEDGSIPNYNFRWLLRSAMLFALPLCFSMIMDSSYIGDWLRLSFAANDRTPPIIFGKLECVLPSFLVGMSIFWIILGVCWLFCTPATALLYLVISALVA
jgi:hypothetical protein